MPQMAGRSIRRPAQHGVRRRNKRPRCRRRARLLLQLQQVSNSEKLAIAAHCLQIDWDYHMRLCRGLARSTHEGCIVHAYHYRHWRLTGVAYELRNCAYAATNSTLLSMAQGRRKEFMDRYVPEWAVQRALGL
jgi:hypothetical protein